MHQHHKDIDLETSLAVALAGLEKIISQRIRAHFGNQPLKLMDWLQQEFPKNLPGMMAQQIPLVQHPFEWIIVMLTLAPHIAPAFFENIIAAELPNGGNFPEMGGVKGAQHRGLLPTGETALFILAGTDIRDRLAAMHYFSAQHFFGQQNMIYLDPVPYGEPAMSGRLVLTSEYLDLLLTGTASKPRFSARFPARLIETGLQWEDLVLAPEVLEQIQELGGWLRHNEALMRDWGMAGKIKRGYRVLFHGPPGTGKTLTASLLGKYTGREVYRIDLSLVVSKYIGETEKNLEHLFARAESRNWILLFDEADALFGKRTGVRDAHDKYANQEVSYLLQRIEDFDGLVILASNMKTNIDDAFIRRFNAIIKFSLPCETDRERIWQKSFPSAIGFADGINIPEAVKQFDLTGGNIINVVQYACLRGLGRPQPAIYLEDVMTGIKKELHKEGKAFR